MSTVFWESDDITQIDQARLDRLKQAVRGDSRGIARICLHRDLQEGVHEMIIGFRYDAYVRPHRHMLKSESFHVIEGNLAVILFDDDGRVTKRIDLSPPGGGRSFLYRLNTSLWHTVIPISEYVIIHEVTNGPFSKEETQYPIWGPREEEPDMIRDFLRRITCF